MIETTMQASKEARKQARKEARKQATKLSWYENHDYDLRGEGMMRMKTLGP